ncbi:hypothetical protein CYMTET_37313 [Cymbomonas tetramitiformis]|uniref:Uncharacterized protein n=1 Tax=Cymbomonas tetramitiformis TaxID=36881 RepID=A0AAE0CE69_9CHLO|nr:hypothetical protein CYMTET_37313 [Cymbomonas tetramitiformis]
MASTVLGGSSAEDRGGRRSLVDLIKFTVRQARSVDCQGLYRQLEYPAREVPRPILEEEQRLVLENDEEDWKPTEASRRTRMFKMLDKKFYRQLREKYAVPSDLAKVSLIGLGFEIVEVYLSWCEEEDEEGLGSAAYSGGERGTSRSVGFERDRDDERGSASILRRIAECEVRLQEAEARRAADQKKIADLEDLLRNGSGDLSHATSRRPGGFRPGGGPLKNAKVAFDRTTRTAKAECPRCPGQYQDWYQCNNKDKTAEHQPTNREVKTMALVQIFNDAAQVGGRWCYACVHRTTRGPGGARGRGSPWARAAAVARTRTATWATMMRLRRSRNTHATFYQPVVPGANALLASSEETQKQSAQPYVGGYSGQSYVGEFYAGQERMDAERLLAVREAIERQSIEREHRATLGRMPAAGPERNFYGGFTVEPAAEQGGGEQLVVHETGGEIGCEPCEQEAEPVQGEISAVPTRPMGCGNPPLGASQRLIWTVCMLCLCVGTVGAFAHLAYEHPASEVTVHSHGVWRCTAGGCMLDVRALPPEVYEDVMSALRAGGAVPAGGAAGAGGAAAAGGAAGAGGAYAAGGAAAGDAAEYDEYEDYDEELEFYVPAGGVTADGEI